MNNINTVLVAFSATSIHKKLAKAAFNLAEENNEKLIILNVRDKNVTQMVAKVTKDHGFLGRDVVEKLTDEIKKDRDELIEHRLNLIESEAAKRGIDFEIVKAKGDFVKQVVEIAKIYCSNAIFINVSESIKEQIKRELNTDIFNVH